MSNGVDEILLTFRQEEHILIVAKNVMILTLAKTKTPEVCYTSGVFYSFCYGGLDHRLITDYLSPSNHLQTRWLITPATTAITRDVIAST